MIDKLTKWVRKLLKRDHQLVLCVPSRDRGPGDPVDAIYAVLPRLCKGSPRCLRVDPKPRHFQEIAGIGKPASARTIVLFAHPHLSFDGFAANGLLGALGETLTPSWWSSARGPFEMIVAHVCYGKEVLDNQSWRETFPAWVSYDDSIDAYLGSEHSRQVWGDIAKAIVDSAQESRTPRGLADRIRSAYLSKMADLRDFGQAEDVVHVMHFEKAMGCLVFSKEEQE